MQSGRCSKLKHTVGNPDASDCSANRQPMAAVISALHRNRIADQQESSATGGLGSFNYRNHDVISTSRLLDALTPGTHLARVGEGPKMPQEPLRQRSRCLWCRQCWRGTLAIGCAFAIGLCRLSLSNAVDLSAAPLIQTVPAHTRT